MSPIHGYAKPGQKRGTLPSFTADMDEEPESPGKFILLILPMCDNIIA